MYSIEELEKKLENNEITEEEYENELSQIIGFDDVEDNKITEKDCEDYGLFVEHLQKIGFDIDDETGDIVELKK